ncbi:MAG: DNA polymerase III subunit delta' [Helicobacteraceae bacterium]
MTNKLFITNDLDAFYEDLQLELNTKNIVLFDDEDFKIEAARALIEQAFLASPEQKFIIVKAKTYNEVSQNALLKILEEPLENVAIYLIGLSKSVFLPTIRSRLIVQTKTYSIERSEPDFDFSRLSLEAIYEFLINNNRFMGKDLAGQYVDLALRWYQNSQAPLDGDLLELFGAAKRLIHLNANAQTVLVTLMLKILDVVKNAKPKP